MYLFVLLFLLLHPLMTGLFTEGILLEEIVGLRGTKVCESKSFEALAFQ